MEKLMLSADGDVVLYEVEKKIINDFDSIIEDFFKWKKTNCYNEQLFVKFIQQKIGNETIQFVKNLGWFDENNIPEEYKNIKWYNF